MAVKYESANGDTEKRLEGVSYLESANFRNNRAIWRALPGETEVLGVYSFPPSLNGNFPLPWVASVVSILPNQFVRHGAMQALERTNNRVSLECVKLLIRERSKGKSLRQLGRIFNRSHERIRQVLARCDLPQEPLLPEAKVAANLGYPVNWLIQLRKEGIINPIKRGHYWIYSQEQVKQIVSLIAERRKCERCHQLRPPHYQRFCRECSQYRKNTSIEP